MDAKHRDIRIGPRSAGCAFLRTGYFCAAQSKEFDIATSVQCGFCLLNRWRPFCDAGLVLMNHAREHWDRHVFENRSTDRRSPGDRRGIPSEFLERSDPRIDDAARSRCRVDIRRDRRADSNRPERSGATPQHASIRTFNGRVGSLISRRSPCSQASRRTARFGGQCNRTITALVHPHQEQACVRVSGMRRPANAIDVTSTAARYDALIRVSEALRAYHDRETLFRQSRQRTAARRLVQLSGPDPLR